MLWPLRYGGQGCVRMCVRVVRGELRVFLRDVKAVLRLFEPPKDFEGVVRVMEAM